MIMKFIFKCDKLKKKTEHKQNKKPIQTHTETKTHIVRTFHPVSRKSGHQPTLPPLWTFASRLV